MPKGKNGGPIFTEEALLEAVPGSKGIIGHIAKRLGCEQGTVNRAIKRYPKFKKALSDEREVFIDELEGQLAKNAMRDDAIGSASVMFGLKCLGKKRGGPTV